MIYHLDDTGFTADGEFVSNGELHRGGIIFFQQRRPAACRPLALAAMCSYDLHHGLQFTEALPSRLGS